MVISSGKKIKPTGHKWGIPWDLILYEKGVFESKDRMKLSHHPNVVEIQKMHFTRKNRAHADISLKISSQAVYLARNSVSKIHNFLLKNWINEGG